MIKGRIRKTLINKNGYVQVTLSHEGKLISRRVARLVLLTFVGPCPDGQEARHRSGRRTDNRLENLLWGTKIENAADREQHGTTARGERHGKTKLTTADVITIRSLCGAGVEHEKIAAQYGISRPAVSAIKTGRNWGHVT